MWNTGVIVIRGAARGQPPCGNHVNPDACPENAVCPFPFRHDALSRIAGVVFFALTLLSPALIQGQPVLLKSFGFPNQSTGAYPQARMIQADDGAFYGTTGAGGTNNNGVIFQITSSGTYTVIHHFRNLTDGGGPYGELIEGREGALYGVTYRNIFALNKDGSGFRLVRVFSRQEGLNLWGLCEGSDGRLYGAAGYGGARGGGSVFGVNKDGSDYSVLHAFDDAGGLDGAHPSGGLIEANDGFLYGTTSAGGQSGGGTVFRVGTSGTGYRLLHSFAALEGGGANPIGRLLQTADGSFYGCTEGTGLTNYDSSSLLYLTGNGTIFRISTDGNAFAIVHKFADDYSEGFSPVGPLVQDSAGVLRGVNYFGGVVPANTGFDSVQGGVFSLAPPGNQFGILHTFASPAGGDGQEPNGLVLATDGFLYGTTFAGGGSGRGMVFKIDPSSSAETNLHDFALESGGDGYRSGGLIYDGSAIYGVTGNGGLFDRGTLFKIHSDGSGYSVLQSFNSPFPSGNLMIGSDGLIYGTAGYGPIYKMNLDGSGLVALAASGSQTSYATDIIAVIEGTDGFLYGATASSNLNPSRPFRTTNGPPSTPTDPPTGAIFKIAKDGSGYSTLFQFQAPAGGTVPPSPVALIQGRDGIFYGIVSNPSTNEQVAIFGIDSEGKGYRELFSVPGSVSNVLYPGNSGSLIQGRAGTLFGTLSPGTPDGDTIVFKINTDGTAFAVLRDFGPSGQGDFPQGNLIEGIDGALYGKTASNVFRIATDGSGFATLMPLNYFVPPVSVNGGPSFPFGLAPGEFGFQPQSYWPLVQLSNGAIYGTTPSGGAMGLGGIFRLSPGVAGATVARSPSRAQISFVGGAPSQIYRIQATSNLGETNSWRDVGSMSAGYDGTFQFVDPAPGTNQARFYRSVNP